MSSVPGPPQWSAPTGPYAPVDQTTLAKAGKQAKAPQVPKPPKPPKPPKSPKAARAKAPKKRWLVVSALLAVVALMIGSGVAGWMLANHTLVASASTGDEEIAAVEPVVISDEAIMPDIRGLSEQDARQVLADNGYLASSITVVDEASATQPGIIISQDPVFGTANVTEITLGVAIPAVVPDAIGLTRDAVVTELAALGVSTDIVLAYSADQPAGTVLAITPESGEPLTDTATLTVATTGASIGLDTVATVTNNCSSWSTVLLSGRSFPQSVMCETDDEPEETIWVIGTLADRFTTTIGINDTQPPGTTATVTFLLDGVVIAEHTPAYGKPIDIDLPIAGGIQLAVRVSGAPDIKIGLGDPLLFGSDTNIEILAER